MSKVFIEPVKTFFYTFKILSDIRKEVQQFSFSESNQTKIKGEIENTTYNLLQDKLKNYGVDIIKTEVEQDILNHINKLLKEHACSESNNEVHQKLDQLTVDFLSNLNTASLYDTTVKEILDYINQEIKIYACNGYYKKIHNKLENVTDQHVDSLTSEIILPETQKAISDYINQKCTEWACRENNQQVVEKGQSISQNFVSQFSAQDIYQQTEQSIQHHLNENILNYVRTTDNKIVQKKVKQLHDELVEKLDSSTLTSETKNNVIGLLNLRICERAEIPAVQEMVKKAEQLLVLFLDQCQSIEVVESKTIAAMNKKLNHIVLQLLNTSEKLQGEAFKIFDEILKGIHAENIDPIIRMQIESALYNVITKELAVYGNENLVQKAVELMHELSKRIPQESSVNDLIMQHNTRKIPSL